MANDGALRRAEAPRKNSSRAKDSSSRAARARPLHPRKVRRRWLWRTFLLGLALGMLWAGWKQAVADVAHIRRLFQF